MKKFFLQVISSVMVLLIFVSAFFCTPMISASAMGNDYSVGDTIVFGSYPQSKVSSQSLISQLNLKVSDDLLNSTVMHEGNKYLKLGSNWYAFEEISWKILDIIDGKLFVQSVKVLDCKAYNSSGSASNWENSSLNKWLNSTFYNSAFASTEKSAIQNYTIENSKCKVFIISYSDAVNTKYGFNSSSSYDDPKRMAYSTTYAQQLGADSGSCDWMLRGNGVISQVNYSLRGDGCVGTCHGTYSVSKEIGIRPVMVVNYAKQTHTVPDYQNKNADYADKYFNGCAVACDGYSSDVDLCIPGLSASYAMVPQGLAYYAAKNWILISAYYNDGKICGVDKEHSSRLFALDMTTGGFIAEFYLEHESGRPYVGHAGGIAVTGNNLYITSGTSEISYIPLSDLDADVDTLRFKGSYDASKALNGAKTSYLSFSDGVLWTGNCYGKKTGEKYSKSTFSVMIGYSISGDSSEEEWNSLANRSMSSYTVEFPNSMDYIQSATVAEGKMIAVSSFGRGNDSTVYIGDINSACTLKNIKSFSGIPMMEGFFLLDGYMYFITESGAYNYYGFDKSKMAKNPTDVVWKLDYKTMLGMEKYPSTRGDVTAYNASFTDGGNAGSTLINFKQSWFAKNSLTYNHELAQLCS